MNTTLDNLRTILIKDYQLAPAALAPEAELAALGIDSLGVAELLFNIEDHFQIKLPAEPVALRTLGEVAAFIDALVLAQHGSPGPTRPASVPAALA